MNWKRARKSIWYGLEEGKRENDVIILDSQEQNKNIFSKMQSTREVTVFTNKIAHRCHL